MMSPSLMSLQFTRLIPHLQTTIVTFAYFFHIVFEALQGVNAAGEDNDTIADKACFVGAVHFTIRDISAGHVAHFGDMVNLANVERCGNFFFEDRLQHTLHCLLHIIDRIVDDRVLTNLYAVAICDLACCLTGTHLEANNHGL